MIIQAILLSSLLVASTAQSADVELTWVPPTTYTDGTPLEDDLMGYELYRCRGKGCQPVFLRSLELGTRTIDTGLRSGRPYRYCVTAMAIGGEESQCSNIAEITLHGPTKE